VTTMQQPLDIRQTASLDLVSLPLLLAKRQAHQLSLVLLYVKDRVLNGARHMGHLCCVSMTFEIHSKPKKCPHVVMVGLCRFSKQTAHSS